MTVYVINIFVYLFAAWLLWLYADNAFGCRRSKPVQFAAIFGVHAVQCALCCLFQINWVNMAFGMGGIFLLLWLLYEQKPFVAVLHTVMLYALMTFAEYLVLPFLALVFKTDFNGFHYNATFYFFAAILSKLLDLVFTVLLLKIYLSVFKKRSQRAAKNAKGLLFSLIIPVTSITVLCLVQYHMPVNNMTKADTVIWTITAVLLMLSTFFVFYYRNFLLQQAEEITALNLEKQQQEYDIKYVELVDKNSREMQILSHDFKNHLVQLEHAENVEQVRAYIHELYPSIQSFNAATVSENKTLNLLVSKYNTLCAVQGVDFSYRITGTDLSFLEAADLTSLLGNLLDNALEAAAKSSEKKMELDIFLKNNTTAVVYIQNAAETAPQTENWALKSTKKQADLHGFGLQSVQSTLKKYSGFYEWNYEEEKKRFSTTVSFYCKEES